MIAVPFIYFTLLLFYIIYKRKAFDIASAVVSVYILSSFFSILIDILDLYGRNGVCDKIEINILPTITYCLFLTITILPFYHFKNTQIREVELTKPKLFKYVSVFFMLVFVLTILLVGSDIKNILTGDFGEARADYYSGDIDNSYSNASGFIKILAYIPNIFSNFYPIPLLLFFYSVTFLKKSIWFNLALFISSLSRVAIAILSVDRTQVIYWLMLYYILYILFAPFSTKEIRKLIVKPFLIFGSIVIVYMLAVTVSRFGEQDSGTEGGLITYAGQSFINYCLFFDNFQNSSVSFIRIFPLINRYFGENISLDDYRQIVMNHSGLNIGVFYTFLGDLIVDLGHMGMFVFCTIYYFLSRSLLYRRNPHTINIAQLILLIMLISVPLHGVFYYKYYSYGEGFYVLGSFIMFFVFKYTVKTI